MVVLLIVLSLLEGLFAVPSAGLLDGFEAAQVAELAFVPLLAVPVRRPRVSAGCSNLPVRRLGYLAGALLVVSLALRNRRRREPLTDEQREKFRNL